MHRNANTNQMCTPFVRVLNASDKAILAKSSCNLLRYGTELSHFVERSQIDICSIFQ